MNPKRRRRTQGQKLKVVLEMLARSRLIHRLAARLVTKYAIPTGVCVCTPRLDFSVRLLSTNSEPPTESSSKSTSAEITIEAEGGIEDNSKKQVPVLDISKFTKEIKVKMPDMGEGEGKILKWYKKEGDVVLRGDVLCDIETVDFTFGMENDDEETAIMGQIFFEAPSEGIKDNQVICTLLHEEKPKKEDKKEE